MDPCFRIFKIDNALVQGLDREKHLCSKVEALTASAQCILYQVDQETQTFRVLGAEKVVFHGVSDGKIPSGA